MPVGKESINTVRDTENIQRLLHSVDVLREQNNVWEALAKELYLLRLKHTPENEHKLSELFELVDNWVRAEEGELSVYDVCQRKRAAFSALSYRLLG